ncbi:ATP-binding protein [Streptomyces sp. NPDC058576]|uniref:ATP-binding protein n=1 Tax=Streptomyces sp. NPDC058576 TaxID=3346547 RepID=UPI003659A9A2
MSPLVTLGREWSPWSLAGERFDTWGIPYGSDVHDALARIVLSANAVSHGLAPGRDLRLRLLAESTTVRVEVTDTRGERLPALSDPSAADQEGGRGLLLVAALTDRVGPVPPRRGPRRDRLGLAGRTSARPGAEPPTGAEPCPAERQGKDCLRRDSCGYVRPGA